MEADDVLGWIGAGLLAVVTIAAFIAVRVVILWYMWNWLAPQFGWHAATFMQAAIVVVMLAYILPSSTICKAKCK